MKKVLILFALILSLTQTSSAQSGPYQVVFEDSNGSYSLKTEYYLDNNKILHWKMTVSATYPYSSTSSTGPVGQDEPFNDNMLQFNVYEQGAPISVFEMEWNRDNFPYDRTDVYTGTVDLSSYSTSQISQLEYETSFYYGPQGLASNIQFLQL